MDIFEITRHKKREDLFGNKVIDVEIIRRGKRTKGMKAKMTWQLFINQILIDRDIRKKIQIEKEVS